MIEPKLPLSAHLLSVLPLTFALFSKLFLLALLLAGANTRAVANPAQQTAIPSQSAIANTPGKQTTTSGSVKTPTTLSSYYSTLQSYEAEGPYHQSSSEVLYGLGLQLQKSGQHGKALKALRRAMHINRVNDGLNSLSQAPMLRGIINSQKSMADIEPVTTSYNQLIHLHTASYGKQDPRLAPLLKELGLWHLDAYHFDNSDKRVDHLTASFSLLMSALHLSKAKPGASTQQQTELLRSAALVSFHLSRHEGDQWSSSTDSHYSLSADGFATRVPQRTGILSGNSFRLGRNFHERIVELTAADPNATLKENIQAQTELADWYLLFNHKDEAMLRYQKILMLIAASDQAETLHKEIFASPHLLPAIRMEDQRGTISTLFITANVDISEKGWGSHIETFGEALFPGQNLTSKKKLHYMMVDAIKGARFRPQFIDNKPTYVSAVPVKLPLIH